MKCLLRVISRIPLSCFSFICSRLYLFFCLLFCCGREDRWTDRNRQKDTQTMSIDSHFIDYVVAHFFKQKSLIDGRQTGRWTDLLMGRQTDRQKNKEIDQYTDKMIGKQTDTRTGRQIGRWISVDIQINEQIDIRSTNRFPFFYRVLTFQLSCCTSDCSAFYNWVLHPVYSMRKIIIHLIAEDTSKTCYGIN